VDGGVSGAGGPIGLVDRRDQIGAGAGHTRPNRADGATTDSRGFVITETEYLSENEGVTSVDVEAGQEFGQFERRRRADGGIGRSADAQSFEEVPPTISGS